MFDQSSFRLTIARSKVNVFRKINCNCHDFDFFFDFTYHIYMICHICFIIFTSIIQHTKIVNLEIQTKKKHSQTHTDTYLARKYILCTVKSSIFSQFDNCNRSASSIRKHAKHAHASKAFGTQWNETAATNRAPVLPKHATDTDNRSQLSINDNSRSQLFCK